MQEIRKAKIEDASQIYLLGKKSHELSFSPKYPFHELSEIREFISKPKENIIFIAQNDDKIMGFIQAKILAHHAAGWCMLDNIYVESHHRHQGTGEKC